METAALVAINALLGGLSLALPQWIVLLWILPTAYVCTTNALLPPVVVLGSARIGSQDLVLAIVAARMLLAWRSRPKEKALTKVYSSASIYFAVLAGATFLAILKFGPEVFKAEATALARFAAQAAVLPLLWHAVQKRKALIRACSSFPWVGYAIALNVFLGAAFALFGLRFGETVLSSRGTGMRVFGFIGDTAGYMLVLFVLLELAKKRPLRAAGLASAIILTGTVGAVTTLFTSLLVLPTVLPMGRNQRRIIWIGIPVIALTVMGSVVANFGMIGSRTYGFTANQRLTSISVGLEFFLRNPISGLGFAGVGILVEKEGLQSEFLNRIGVYAVNYSSNASNQWIQCLCDAGLFGVVAFAALLWALLKLLKKAARERAGPVTAIAVAGYCWLIGLAAGNQTAVWFLPGSLITHWIWVIAALAAAPVKLAVNGRSVTNFGGQDFRRRPLSLASSAPESEVAR